jgi:DHA1 family tetracycline resistance protein-like MFS transporter
LPLAADGARGATGVLLSQSLSYNCPALLRGTGSRRLAGPDSAKLITFLSSTVLSRIKRSNVDRRLVTILAIVFVNMLGAAMILPLLPLYAESEFELSPQIIALLTTSFFAAQFVAGPFLGRLSDKHGRIPVLILSQIGTVISFVMLAGAQSAWVLFLARILDGITGGNIIVAQAYITDITPRERRTESLGYVFAVFGLGFVIGPALGGILSASLGARVPYIIAAFVALAVVLMTWFTLQETLTPERRQAGTNHRKGGIGLGEVLSNTPLLLILLVAFIGQSSLGLLQATFALYAEAVLFKGHDPQTSTLGVGLLLAVIGLSQFSTQAFLLRRMLRRFGEYRLVILGNSVRMIGSFVFAVATTPLLGAGGSLFFAMGLGLMMPSLQSLATGTVDDDVRGGVLGLYQSSLSLSTIVSTAVGGLLFAVFAALPYWVAGTMAAIALIPAVILFLRFGRTAGEAKAEYVSAD